MDDPRTEAYGRDVPIGLGSLVGHLWSGTDGGMLGHEGNCSHGGAEIKTLTTAQLVSLQELNWSFLLYFWTFFYSSRLYPQFAP